MLQAVDAENNQGTVLAMSLEDPADGFLVKDIEGLDPVDAVIVSSPFGGMDGEQYQSSRRGKRTLVIKLDLRTEYRDLTAGELRSILYGYFMPKMDVTLRFHDDRIGTVEIKGVVESFSAPLFVQEPEAVITVLCMDSDFRTPETYAVYGNTNDTYTDTLLRYEGSVDTSVILRVFVNRMVNEITLYHSTPTNEDGSIPFLGPLLAGDQLIISTVPGQKGATLVRDFAERPVLYGISPFSQWVTLKPGDNYIRVQAGGSPIPYSLEFVNRYGGL